MARWTDLADWRGPSPNKSAGGQDEVRGLVVHIAEGYYEGTISWQRNPTSDVSSHFVVGRDGRIAQMVDTTDAAWTQRAGNGEWLSVECVGFTKGHRLHKAGWERLTAAQIDALARLLLRCNQMYGVPLQATSSPSGRGLGHHSMGGASWGHRACPGDPIIAQKDDIVRATGNAAEANRPRHLTAPAPTLRDRDQGPRVGQLQAAMNAILGTGLDVDEDFGPRTRRTLQDFQRRVGIADDGIYGPVAAGRLAQALADLEDDMDLDDTVKVTDWTTKTWGVKALNVEQALSDGYTYSRSASDKAFKLLVEQAKQTALLEQLLAAHSGLTENAIRDAVTAGVTAAIDPAAMATAIAEGLDGELDLAATEQAVETALRNVLGSLDGGD